MEAAPPLEYPSARRVARAVRWLWQHSAPWMQHRLRKWAIRWLHRHAPVRLPYQGGWIVLDGPGTVALSLLLHGAHEPEQSARFAALLRPGMTVLDVGANLGAYSLLAARCVGADGAVHAFEPVPAIFRYLTASVRLSQRQNVALNECAVADQPGHVPMFLTADRHSGSHSLAPSERRPRRIDVRQTTLDAYLAEREIQRVDLLKIDVEGAELLVLRGARQMLSGVEAPLIQMEICPKHLARFGATPQDIHAFLGRCGYAAYRIAPGEEWAEVDPAAPCPRLENLVFARPSHRSALASAARSRAGARGGRMAATSG